MISGVELSVPHMSATTQISHRDRLEYAVTVPTVELPRSCVSEVIVNQEALQQLPPQLQHYASSSYLLSHARLSVPRSTEGALNQISNCWCGRVIPVEYGSYPADGIRYTVVTQKGGLVAGAPYLAIGALPEDDEDYPYGYVYKQNADIEVNASNIALAYGIRSSLSLGTIILDPDGLKTWLGSAWSRQYSGQTTLLGILEHMQSWGGIPAIVMRMNSQLSRIEFPPNRGSNSITWSDTFQSQREMVAIAQQRIAFANWIAEVTAFPNQARTFLRGSGVTIKQLVAALDKLAYNPLSSRTRTESLSLMKTFFAYYCGMVNHQKECARELYREHPSRFDVATRVLLLLGREKDMEPTLVRTDFERDPFDPDNLGRLSSGQTNLSFFEHGLNTIVDSHGRTLKNFFPNAGSVGQKIFEVMQGYGLDLGDDRSNL